MAYGRKELGRLTNQLAEALDDLALVVESYRMKEHTDPKVVRAFEVAEQAILKARKQSRQ